MLEDKSSTLLSALNLQQVEPFLELIGNIGIQFHTGLQPPEQVGGDDRIAVCRPGIGHGADVLVDAQDFLNDHDTCLGLARRHGEIGFDVCPIHPTRQCRNSCSWHLHASYAFQQYVEVERGTLPQILSIRL